MPGRTGSPAHMMPAAEVVTDHSAVIVTRLCGQAEADHKYVKACAEDIGGGVIYFALKNPGRGL